MVLSLVPTCAVNFRWVAISPKRDPERLGKTKSRLLGIGLRRKLLRGLLRTYCLLAFFPLTVRLAHACVLYAVLHSSYLQETMDDAQAASYCFLSFLKSHFRWNYSRVLLQLVDCSDLLSELCVLTLKLLRNRARTRHRVYATENFEARVLDSKYPGYSKARQVHRSLTCYWCAFHHSNYV
jgi:hypothetical protein